MLRHLRLLLLSWAFAPLAPAQISDSDVPRDEARGRWMNFEVGLLEPFEFHPDGERVYLINQPGNRLVFMDRVT